MKHYFISNDGIKKGPLSLEALQEETILKNTLIWREGLKDWVKAENVEELKELIISFPPPISEPPSLIYDENYVNDSQRESVLFVAIVLIIITILVNVYPHSINFRRGLLALSALIRIVFVFWVVSIAKEQNRNRLDWGIFAFFLPTISLIVIVYQKKLRD